jgi:hypothetical protein
MGAIKKSVNQATKFVAGKKIIAAPKQKSIKKTTKAVATLVSAPLAVKTLTKTMFITKKLLEHKLSNKAIAELATKEHKQTSIAYVNRRLKLINWGKNGKCGDKMVGEMKVELPISEVKC